MGQHPGSQSKERNGDQKGVLLEDVPCAVPGDELGKVDDQHIEGDDGNRSQPRRPADEQRPRLMVTSPYQSLNEQDWGRRLW